jgi:uncharacterized membrane protein YgcG
MGRPRKPETERLTRTITARVTDEQYDELIDDAVHLYEGDLSKALRGALDSAGMLRSILTAADPQQALADLLARSDEEEARELYYEEHGEYPPE